MNNTNNNKYNKSIWIKQKDLPLIKKLEHLNRT